MNQLIIASAAFIFGTLIGSFLNVVIWRLPRGESLGGRSKCPHCHYTLGVANLVPLISFLWQGGRCANCRKPMSVRYPVIEAATGLLFAVAATQTLAAGIINASSLLDLFRLAFIIPVLIIVFVIDMEHYLILDVVIFPAIVAVLALNIAIDLSGYHSVLILSSHTGGGVVAAALAGGFFYLLWAVSKGRWMGFGDVKLALFLGIALGLPGIAVGLFLSFMIGAIVGVALIAAGKKHLQSHVPFGTFLSIGALLALFYGPALSAWYARLVGWR